MLTFLNLVYDLREKFRQHTHTHAVLLCYSIKAHFNFDKTFVWLSRSSICVGNFFVRTTTHLRTRAGQTYLFNIYILNFVHLKQTF